MTEFDSKTGASHSVMVQDDGSGATVTHITSGPDMTISISDGGSAWQQRQQQQQPRQGKRPCRMHDKLMMMQGGAAEGLDEAMAMPGDDGGAGSLAAISVLESFAPLRQQPHAREQPQVLRLDPQPYVGSDLSFEMQDAQGNLNWGLLTLLALSAASVGVMWSFVAALLQLRRATSCPQYCALDSDTLDVPLLAGKAAACSEGMPVQYASEHAGPGCFKNIDIRYVVLSGSDSK
jgi:hypothetical protein